MHSWRIIDIKYPLLEQIVQQRTANQNERGIRNSDESLNFCGHPWGIEYWTPYNTIVSYFLRHVYDITTDSFNFLSEQDGDDDDDDDDQNGPFTQQ